MQRLGLEGTVRASFAVYNTRAEVEVFAQAVAKIASLKNK
jgi:cysteine desulfurase/selenocysteine lyase